MKAVLQVQLRVHTSGPGSTAAQTPGQGGHLTWELTNHSHPHPPKKEKKRKKKKKQKQKEWRALKAGNKMISTFWEQLQVKTCQGVDMAPGTTTLPGVLHGAPWPPLHCAHLPGTAAFLGLQPRWEEGLVAADRPRGGPGPR